MRRRDFITLIGGAAALPLGARAQQAERMRRIGVLMGWPESDRRALSWVAALRGNSESLGGRRAATSRSTLAGRRRMSSQ